MTDEDLLKTLRPENYTGRAPEQTEEFLEEVVRPILSANKDILGIKAEINV